MNKYQREKAKRMKKLANLGISYSYQKRIMRTYNLDQVDKMIEQINILKNSGVLEKLQNLTRHVCKTLLKLIIGIK